MSDFIAEAISAGRGGDHQRNYALIAIAQELQRFNNHIDNLVAKSEAKEAQERWRSDDDR